MDIPLIDIGHDTNGELKFSLIDPEETPIILEPELIETTEVIGGSDISEGIIQNVIGYVGPMRERLSELFKSQDDKINRRQLCELIDTFEHFELSLRRRSTI
jgi:hypothetical protein